jgi:hypothetical protein
MWSRPVDPYVEAANTVIFENTSYLNSDVDVKGPPAKDDCRSKVILSPVVYRAAAVAKAKLGLLEDTRANRLIVDSEIRKWMRDLGMRPTHIVRYAPLAVEVTLIATDEEIAAAGIRHTATFQERKPGKTQIW